jgi:hypothetical protein
LILSFMLFTRIFSRIKHRLVVICHKQKLSSPGMRKSYPCRIPPQCG